MPKGMLQDKEDCVDFVRGCRFMGTGGGGGIDWGMEILLNALNRGSNLAWVDPSDIPDDMWTCTIYLVGSIAPPSSETKNRIKSLGITDHLRNKASEVAVKELSSYTGVDIGAIVAVELGAGNTPTPLVAGVEMGLQVVDGDYAGRAVPEEMQSTPYLYNKNSFPLASVDKWGDVVLLKEASNPPMLERITKMLSVAAFGKCTIAATLLRGKEMKEIVVPGTLTKCLQIGRTIRKAREEGKNPVKAAVQYLDGWLLFTGEVVDKDWEDRGGYMFGTINIQGDKDYKGHNFKVWFKNENLVSWMDGEPYVSSPDLIVIAERETGEGLTNTNIEAGQKVAVIGAKGVDEFRSERGLAGCGPRYFGFDIDYVPIETLMKG